MQTPISRSAATLQAPRKLKAPGSDSPIIKTSKDRSPKTVERRLPRPPPTEKKRPNRGSEPEPHMLLELQEELKKTKEQLSSSESWKRRAQQEAEEARRQLSAMSEELKESQNQLKELSESEEARLHELRKISQERDREWQSELEAFQKQYTMDSAALASSMNEIQKLKMQLERVSQSEAAQARHAESAHGEIRSLRIELTETLDLVEKLKNKLNDSREYEAQALEELNKAEMQLEDAKTAEIELKLEHDTIVQSYHSLTLELEESNNRVKSLEAVVASLQSDQTKFSAEAQVSAENVCCQELVPESTLDTEAINTLKSQVSELRTALDNSERRYRDEYTQSTLQIQEAYQLVEETKLESSKKEALLEMKLREVEGLKSRLSSKLEEDNYPPQREAELELELELEHKRSESALQALKACLLDKEALLQSMEEENKKLKQELTKTTSERSIAEDEALKREEVDKKAARVAEELGAAQASNTELEGELRRLKVQCDQWRKAAEAAAAMLSTSGKCRERRGSFDYSYVTNHKLGSPVSDDEDEDSTRKKNGNMLKKIGELLKKGHK